MIPSSWQDELKPITHWSWNAMHQEWKHGQSCSTTCSAMLWLGDDAEQGELVSEQVNNQNWFTTCQDLCAQLYSFGYLSLYWMCIFTRSHTTKHKHVLGALCKSGVQKTQISTWLFFAKSCPNHRVLGIFGIPRMRTTRWTRNLRPPMKCEKWEIRAKTFFFGLTFLKNVGKKDNFLSAGNRVIRVALISTSLGTPNVVHFEQDLVFIFVVKVDHLQERISNLHHPIGSLLFPPCDTNKRSQNCGSLGRLELQGPTS